MVEKDPFTWAQTTWALLLSSAIFAYSVRLLDKIRNKRLRSLAVEFLEFIVCIGIAFGVYLTSSFFGMDERIVWLCSVYFSHRGTRFVFARMDRVADVYLSRFQQGDQRVKDSNSDQP